jgi:hypothetical protein
VFQREDYRRETIAPEICPESSHSKDVSCSSVTKDEKRAEPRTKLFFGKTTRGGDVENSTNVPVLNSGENAVFSDNNDTHRYI